MLVALKIWRVSTRNLTKTKCLFSQLRHSLLKEKQNWSCRKCKRRCPGQGHQVSKCKQWSYGTHTPKDSKTRRSPQESHFLRLLSRLQHRLLNRSEGMAHPSFINHVTPIHQHSSRIMTRSWQALLSKCCARIEQLVLKEVHLVSNLLLETSRAW